MSRRRFTALPLAALCLSGSMFLTACSDDATMSAQAVYSEQGRMSGGYRVDPDGRLEKPNVVFTAPKPPSIGWTFDDEGAKAGARHFVALMEYTWNANDTAPLEAFCDDDCQFCSSLIERVRAAYSNGDWVANVRYLTQATTGIEKEPNGVANTYGVRLGVHEREQDAYESGQLHHYPAEDVTLYLILRWENNEWRLNAAVAEVDNG